MNLYRGLVKVIEEYSKVQWPNRSKIFESTAWVITMSVLVSIYLGVFDFAADRILRQLVSLVGGI
ncbi:preprotein translocase subunit SecE [Fusobacterium sp. PH5-44]|uniref:preprotein translocase subunit SecE n=1 Tax=unclassified Fusobacterium TaxID=2648384 RepID=UPI003D1ADD94